MSALFRQPSHKNFRLCGDQLLRHFLKGLTLRLRAVDECTGSAGAGTSARREQRSTLNSKFFSATLKG